MKSKVEIDEQLELPFEYPEVVMRPDPALVPFFPTPETDNEILLNLQYEYKVNGCEASLNALYDFSLEIAKKFVSDFTKQNKRLKRLSLWEREEKAEDAVVYIVSSLIRKPMWYITSSFTGYIYLRVKHELLYHRKVDKIVDFVDITEFFKEGEEDDYGSLYDQPTG